MEFEDMMEYIQSVKGDIKHIQVLFNENSRICGVVWRFKEKKEPALKLYKAGVDSTR